MIFNEHDVSNAECTRAQSHQCFIIVLFCSALLCSNRLVLLFGRVPMVPLNHCLRVLALLDLLGHGPA
jgi:hypothetical protein